ncbi:dTDP-4-dehydrorhamnose reductase [Haloarcula marina]|uniref:dTDP-4-dehydrorhamnose reductase n=1 Tax=Haloarcula marina TaxID=2961574 RepID=UPI0020B89058|nr:dTDP-4-dehydrorhamnose reductase [Halomicroarcula marina]
MNLLVIGASGLVGQNVYKIAQDAGHSVTGTFRSDSNFGDVKLDKTNRDRVESLIQDKQPDAIIDTAAFHDVDACEKQRSLAWEINVNGTWNVAQAADSVNAHLIYLSSDYVFRGDPNEAPYSEDAAVSPLNYYGQCKYAAEQAVKVAETSTIIRPSVIYGNGSTNFATWAINQLRSNNEISIVEDQVSTPTYAPDLARICIQMVIDRIAGLYHASGPTQLSRYKFTCLIAKKFNLNTDLVRPVKTENFDQDATRPKNSSLDSTNLYNEIGYQISPPSKGIEMMVEMS